MNLVATPAEKLVALDRTIAYTRRATTEPRYPDDHQTRNESVENRANIGDQFGSPKAWPKDSLSAIAANP